MKHLKKKIDIATILSATYMANSIAEDVFLKYENYRKDTSKEERIKYHLCKTCFYLRNKMGGAMITHQDCGICEKEMVFSSTYTDALCVDCAKKYRLCAHCGGTIDQKYRRKFELKED